MTPREAASTLTPVISTEVGDCMKRSSIDGGDRRLALCGRVAVATALATAMLGIGAQASLAATTIQIGAANNIYPVMKDVATNMAADESGWNAFTFNASGQVGGFWNKAPDATTLRGITSGSLRMQLKGAGPYTGCDPSTGNCVNGPLAIDGFWSADQSNVDQVIPTGSGGTCSGAGVTCPGVASTKGAVAIGHLVIYSCSGSWAGSTHGDDPSNGASPPLAFGADGNGSGNGKPQSPRCDATALSPAITTMTALTAWLGASQSHRVAIALPSAAPFGAASQAALTQAGFTYNDTVGSSTRNAYPGTSCDNAPAPPAANACQIRLESGISQVRGAVTANAGSNTQIGLAAKSNVVHISWTSSSLNGTTSDDPNQWTDVPSSAYSSYNSGNGIQQYAVSTNSTTATKMGNLINVQWIGGGDGTFATVLAQYGF